MSDRHRLFLALWPDQETRAQLAAAAERWTRRPVPSDNLHMTLAFLGSCDLDQWRCIDESVSTIISQPFEINIDYLGSWPRSKTQWLGTSCAPEALGELVEARPAVVLGQAPLGGDQALTLESVKSLVEGRVVYRELPFGSGADRAGDAETMVPAEGEGLEDHDVDGPLQ